MGNFKCWLTGGARERLLTEGTARYTAENLQGALAVARSALGEVGVLVTSAFHMPRAIASARDVGWPPLVPALVDYRIARFIDGVGGELPQHLELLDLGIREWLGRVAYRVRG